MSIHDDLGPWLLGALEDDEVERFLAHLDTCASCRHELADLRVVVDGLSLAVPQVSAPPELGHRLMSVVRSEAELLNAAGAQADRPAPRPRRGLLGMPRLALAGVLAALALLAGGIAVGGLALNRGSAEHVYVGRVLASAHGTALLRQRDGRSELDVAGLGAPPDGRTYQVWVARAHRAPQPTDALFTTTTTGRASVAVPGDLRGVRVVMVTDEPPGGSRVPTGRTELIVTLPA